MFQRIILPAAGVLFVFAASAFASEPLTTDQAKRFVDTLPALEALDKQMDAEDNKAKLSIETQPKAGEEFKPYSKVVAALKANHPAEHAKLSNAVKPHGFSTEQWGYVGDRVMISYLALRMQRDDPRAMEMMNGMDASMLNMVPPEMRAQLEQTFVMMDTIKNAPEADKKAVEPVMADLDAYMEENSGS